MTTTIAVIGCGNMGSAIALAVCRAAHSSAPVQTDAPELSTVLVYDVVRERSQAIADAHPGGLVLEELADIAAHSPAAVVIAVKPHLVESTIRALPARLRTLVVSVAAGLEVERLRAASGYPVVRAMPNTPGLVGAGVTSILVDDRVTDEQADLVDTIFATMGTTVRIDRESLMHPATALGGSGPALVAMIVEALADGAVLEGLPRTVAYKMAREMLAGTTMLLEQQSPSELKDKVTSPGGTTIRGVAAAERAGLRHALIDAIRAITARSREMGSE